jgi:hypothetical protein
MEMVGDLRSGGALCGRCLGLDLKEDCHRLRPTSLCVS